MAGAMRCVLVAGALAAKPGNGGEAWVRLSWALGLRRLGFDAWLVEQIDAEACRDASGARSEPATSVNARWFREITAATGFGDRAALVLSSGGSIVGPSQGELLDVAREAELLVNVSGNLRLASLRDRPRRRVYVDVDPAYTQLWHAAGLDAGLGGHDAYLTVGTAVGTDRCPLPTAGLRWLPVLPPVLLDAWPAAPAPPAPPRYTTVTSWRGSYGRVAHAGRLLGQKAHELRRLADLPVRVPEVALELALSIDASDEADAGALRKHGWAVVEAATVAGDPFAFRDYVSGSWGEFSVAQGAYVSTRSGWFSDRSAHYLASGRPVVLQDTGYPAVLPTGEGLLSYVTPADAAAALRCAHADPTAHREAARAIAREHLDAERVIARALERLGVRA